MAKLVTPSLVELENKAKRFQVAAGNYQKALGPNVNIVEDQPKTNDSYGKVIHGLRAEYLTTRGSYLSELLIYTAAMVKQGIPKADGFLYNEQLLAVKTPRKPFVQYRAGMSGQLNLLNAVPWHTYRFLMPQSQYARFTKSGVSIKQILSAGVYGVTVSDVMY